MIDRDEARRIARLAHLEYPRVQQKDGTFTEPSEHLIDDRTLDALARDLKEILEYVRALDEVNVEGVEPTSHGVPLPTKLRSDAPGETLPTERALAAAPQHTGEAIAVPKIVE
jgi:aspartyl-tRNA(Asn)/glutamyl-tRNA(Gln) amidotransferase subunit C